MLDKITTSDIPPILLQKGYTEFEPVTPQSKDSASSVYKVNRPGIGYWIVKRIKKDHALLHKAEKNILTTLKHDFLPTVFDVFEDEYALYIVLEYIPGQSLKEIIAAGHPISEEDIRKFFIQLCQLFTYLHNKDVVHKDCKPSNIMLSPQGNIYLIDFGISKTGEYNAPGRSKNYASPEQMDNPSTDDPRTDIYSLGATMFSLLTSKEFPQEVAQASGQDTKGLAAILAKQSHISKDLKQIVLKCLAPNPLYRYHTMADVEKSLTKKTWAIKAGVAGVIMLLATAGVFFGFSAWQDDLTDNLIHRGNTLMAEGNYTLAQTQFQSYISRRPTAYRGYDGLRRLHMHLQDFSQSTAMFNDNESALFNTFITGEDSISYRNTWDNAISQAIGHYVDNQNWPMMQHTLNIPQVDALVSTYMQAYFFAYMYVQQGMYPQALQAFRVMRDTPWQEYVAANTHAENMLQGAYVADNVGDNQNGSINEEVSLFLSVAHSTAGQTADNPLIALVQAAIDEISLTHGLIMYQHGNYHNAVEFINGQMGEYTFLAHSLPLLELRAISMARVMLQQNNQINRERFTLYANAVLGNQAGAGSDTAQELIELLALIESAG